MTHKSRQDTFAPNSVCFGCGPKNRKGLKVKSHPEWDAVVADWTPQPHHVAFDRFGSGGIISVLMDCNGNWAACHSLMRRNHLSSPPGTVTSEYTVTFLKPTPIDKPWHFRARAARIQGNRVAVRGMLELNGVQTASMRGLFVAVKEGHPAYHRWK
jgi:acyl-coenzyme A thioesterase PaaI-like protein